MNYNSAQKRLDALDGGNDDITIEVYYGHYNGEYMMPHEAGDTPISVYRLTRDGGNTIVKVIKGIDCNNDI